MQFAGNNLKGLIISSELDVEIQIQPRLFYFTVVLMAYIGRLAPGLVFGCSNGSIQC